MAHLQVVYSELTRAVDARLASLRSLQQRAATGAAAAGILLGLLAAARSSTNAPISILALLALLGLLASLVCAAQALWPGRVDVEWPLKPPGSGGLPSLDAYLADDAQKLLTGFCDQLFTQLYGGGLREKEAHFDKWVQRQAALLGISFGLVLVVALAVTVQVATLH